MKFRSQVGKLKKVSPKSSGKEFLQLTMLDLSQGCFIRGLMIFFDSPLEKESWTLKILESFQEIILH